MPPEHQPAYQPKHATELPTHEYPSGSSVGVGSLPGSCNEFGVARLPDERGKANPYVHSHATVFETVFAPYRSHPFKSMLKQQGKGMQRQPDSQLPTKEVPSGSSVGVGSLPGDNDESGVATLPEERHDGKPCGSGYTGFENYTPAEGAKRMQKQRRLSNHEKIEQYFEQCGQRAMPKVDLPLEEEPSGSRVGIGSLPGPNTEVGVAILPEERRHHLGSEVDPSLFMPTTEVITDSYGGVGSLPGPRNEQRVAMTPEERLFPADGILGSHLPLRMDQMPLEEHPSGSVVGIGSLPGTIEESGVAVLPDEQEQMGMPSESQPPTNLKKKKKNAAKKQKSKGIHHDKHTMKGGMAERSEVMESGTGQEGIKSLGMERKGGMKVEGREQEEGPAYSNHDKIVRYFQKVDYHVMPKVDLPSQEEPSGSYEGVGSLPGARHEAGVALLPEERKHHLDNEVHPSLFMPSTEDQMNSVGGVGTLPGKRSEHAVALLPEERLFPADEILGSHLPPRADQLPSREHISGSPVGVGSLPGKRSEQSVALTPEERLHPADKILGSHLPPRMDQMPSREHRSGSTVGVGSLPGQRTEKGVALTPEERHNPADQILMRKDRKQQPPSGKGGHGRSRGKSEANPVRAHTSGFYARSPEGGVRRRQVPRAADRHEEQAQGADCLAPPPTLPKLDEGHQQQRGEGPSTGEQLPQPHSPWQQLSAEELEAERKKAEYAFEMARRTAEMLGAGMTMAVEGVGKVASWITAPRHNKHQTHEEMEADRLMAQQRGERMRNTMGRFESGIGCVGKRVRKTLGWGHEGGSPAAASQVPSTEPAGAAHTGPMSKATTTLGTAGQQEASLNLGPATAGVRSDMIKGLSATHRLQHERENVGRTWNRDQREQMNGEMDTDRMRSHRGGTSGMSADRSSLQGMDAHQQQAQQQSADEEADRRQGQERADMMYKTMEGLGEWSTATVEGLGRGIGGMGNAVGGVGQRVGDMGHRVWQSMGARPEQSASLPQPGVVNVLDMSYFMTLPGESVEPPASNTSMQRMHSNLSPTAPAFVPKAQSGLQKQQADQSSASSSWWPPVSAPSPLSNVMKGVREKVEGYLHLGHTEEGQQDKGVNQSTPKRSSAPRSTSSASTMDALTSHNTRAPGVDDNSSAELHDRVVDAHETISSGTVDTTNEDDEEMMKKVHEAEELLRRAGQEEKRAGIILGRADSEGISTAKSSALQRNLPSESTMQKEAGAEGEVTTLADSAHLGSTRAPLGMPTREEEKQTSVPGNLHEQYFMANEAGTEGEVTTMGDVGDLGTVRPPKGMEELTGVGGVGFDMKPGEGGVLPGYPTSEGMSQLLQERMFDDQIRQARAAGKQGVETSTNTLKSVPHMEPRGPVQVPAPLGPPVNAENLSVPASAPHIGLGSRAESDISVQSVRGSPSEVGMDDFTGNKTPRAGETRSHMGILGTPLGGQGMKGQQEAGEHLAPKQKN